MEIVIVKVKGCRRKSTAVVVTAQGLDEAVGCSLHVDEIAA